MFGTQLMPLSSFAVHLRLQFSNSFFCSELSNRWEYQSRIEYVLLQEVSMCRSIHLVLLHRFCLSFSSLYHNVQLFQVHIADAVHSKRFQWKYKITKQQQKKLFLLRFLLLFSYSLHLYVFIVLLMDSNRMPKASIRLARCTNSI